MTSPNSPKRVLRLYQAVYTGVESVAAGTPATSFSLEPCRAFAPAVQRNSEQERAYTGTAFSIIDDQEMTRWANLSETYAMRVAGQAAQALGCIIGNACGVVSGTAPKIHTLTPPVGTTAMNTLTKVYDSGDRNASNVAQNLLQYAFTSVTGLTLTCTPNGANTAQISLVGLHPSLVSVPTVATYVGSTANYPGTRIPGWKNAFTLIGSDGVTPYTSKVTQCTLQLTRQVDPEVWISSQDPYDFVPDELMLQGSFTATYEGPGAGSLYADLLSYGTLGSAANPQVLTMTIDASNSFAFTFWPLKLTNASHDTGSNRVKLSCSFRTYNDLSNLNKATPAATCLVNAVIKNAVSTPFVT